MLTPPETIMNVDRSARYRQPSSSTYPMSPSDRQPCSLEIDAVLSGSLKYSKAGPPSKKSSPDSPTGSSPPPSDPPGPGLNGLPTEPGWASHSCGSIVVPANPSVPP